MRSLIFVDDLKITALTKADSEKVVNYKAVLELFEKVVKSS